MKKCALLMPALCLLAISFNSTSAFSQARTNGLASVTYVRDVLPIVLGRCYSCHNDQEKVLPSWSDYKTSFEHRLEIKRRVWDSWHGQYYKEPMPAGNSPQCLAMTEAERQTIKEWVEEGAVYGTPPKPGSAGSKAERVECGRQIFATICIACHQANGGGIPDRYPPLAASDFLNADKSRAVKTLLNGRQGEITVNGRKFNNLMPRFPFTDEQIANVLTFVYNSFGNCGKEVAPDEVKALRAQKATATGLQGNTSTQPSPWE